MSFRATSGNTFVIFYPRRVKYDDPRRVKYDDPRRVKYDDPRRVKYDEGVAGTRGAAAEQAQHGDAVPRRSRTWSGAEERARTWSGAEERGMAVEDVTETKLNRPGEITAVGSWGWGTRALGASTARSPPVAERSVAAPAAAFNWRRVGGTQDCGGAF